MNKIGKIDTKLVGWLRTIKWVLEPLWVIYIRKFDYGRLALIVTYPSIRYSYRQFIYVLKRTQYCVACRRLIPIYQYGSSEGSDGSHCAQCLQHEKGD